MALALQNSRASAVTFTFPGGVLWARSCQSPNGCVGVGGTSVPEHMAALGWLWTCPSWTSHFVGLIFRNLDCKWDLEYQYCFSSNAKMSALMLPLWSINESLAFFFLLVIKWQFRCFLNTARSMCLSQRGRLTDERRVSPCWVEGGALQEGCAAQCRVQQCWQGMLAGGTEEQRGWTVLFSHCILPADVLWVFFLHHSFCQCA